MEITDGYRWCMSRERGAKLHLSDQWLQDAQAAMRLKQWDQQTLAKEAKVSNASVTRLFANDTTDAKASRVAKALGIDNPAAGRAAKENAEWVNLGARLRRIDPVKYQETIRLIRVFIRNNDAFTELEQALTPTAKPDRRRRRSGGRATT